MNDNFLTIIIPAYNVESYIGECLDSLVHQTAQNHSVIIIDDGSTDRTAEICDTYARQYPELFYCIHQPNKGQGAARNAALQLVNTEYVTFLDSDDWLDLNFVEKVQQLIQEYYTENLDIIYTLPKIYDAVTGVYTDWFDKSLFFDIFFSSERVISASTDARLYKLEYSACRKICRTSFLKDINFTFEENVKWEDIFPHFYITYKAKKCIGLADVGFCYRFHTSSQTTSSSGMSRLDALYTFDKTMNFMKQEQIPKSERVAILSRLISFLIWSVDESNQKVKRELSRSLGLRFKNIPYSDRIALIRSNCTIKEKVFIVFMRNPILRTLYTDYLLKDTLLRPLKKLKKVITRG